MSENTKPNNERPADLAVQDSVGGMARRLLNPAHLRDLAGRSVKTLREQGAEQLWRDVKFRVGLAMHHDDWRHRADIPLRRELKAQRAAHLQGPKISIIVPLYNTPAKLFDEMLQSVVRQTYTNWELVLVDASDADKRLERRLPKTVPGTIVYEPIENGGIALNTTRGFALAHGEYITLLDHDDVLYPNALFEVVQTIQNTRADFVYSDEIVLSADLKELGGYHFKPDFAPDYLRGVNFITHLAVFSRPLLDAAGAYESKEFDGAQDHDLILRLTEKAQRIEHIKKVLYIWRAAAGSTAAGMEAKPYAVAAGERAIDAQLKRLGLPGHAMAVPDAPGAFQVRYKLTGHPKISVLIPSKDHIDDLDRCLTSLYKNAGYDNFEVIVIENNSTDPATFAYYETLPSRFADCRVVYYKGVFNFSAINNFGRKAAEGDSLAKSMLVQLWLPKVIETAKEMHTRDFFLMDLVQEGNVGLLVALESVVKAETAEQAIDAAVRETISDFMEEHRVQKHKDNTVVNKVNRLKDAIEELSDGDDMDFSVAELSAYLDMSVEEIEDILRIAGEEP